MREIVYPGPGAVYKAVIRQDERTTPLAHESDMAEFRGDRYDQETARRFIDLLVRRTGLSASRLAVGAGVAPSTLTRIYPLPQVPNSLAWHTVRKLKHAYAAYLSAEQPAQNGPRQAGYEARHFAQPERIPVMQMSVTSTSGTSLAETRLELLTGDLNTSIGFLMPGAIPMQTDRTFAIQMPSDVMQPRFRPGETLLVDRIKPMDIGDDVLAELTSDAGDALFVLASVTARDLTAIQLLQTRYGVSAAIPRALIARIYVIVGLLTR